MSYNEGGRGRTRESQPVLKRSECERFFAQKGFRETSIGGDIQHFQEAIVQRL